MTHADWFQTPAGIGLGFAAINFASFVFTIDE